MFLIRKTTEKEKGMLSLALDRTKKQYPRSFSVLFYIILPLVFLNLTAMLFGHFLAVLEKDSELDSIHSTMQDFVEGTRKGKFHNLNIDVGIVYDECLDELMEYTDKLVMGPGIKSHIQNCKAYKLSRPYYFSKDGIDIEAATLLTDSLNFHWNRCFLEDGEEFKPAKEQSTKLFDAWIGTYEESYNKKLENGTKEEIAFSSAVNDARDVIEDSCVVNSAGGAVFWFTIMTTIGYGNTAPVTKEGRILVMTAGFLTLLVATSAIGWAGYICLAIIDDFLIRIKLKRLTKGWPSVFLHFCCLIGAMYLLAEVRGACTYYKSGMKEPLWDRFWFAFISITTIGFGDIYIPHELTVQDDMWYIPFFMLAGFVTLANFALKFGGTIIDIVKNNENTDDDDELSLNGILEQRRLNNNKGVDNEKHPNFPVPKERRPVEIHEIMVGNEQDERIASNYVHTDSEVDV